MKESIDALKQTEKEKMADQSMLPATPTAQRRVVQSQQQTAWLTGAALVGLGGVLLLTNLIGFQLTNWWALFILLPAAKHWQRAARRRDSLVKALVLTLVALTFLFELSWAVMVPAGLLTVGIALLIDGLRDRRAADIYSSSK